MSYFDILFKPWEVIKDGVGESKEALSGKKKDSHDSFLSGVGRLTDPLSFALGKGYTNVVHRKIPKYLNAAAEPFVKVGHYGNPLYWYGKKTGNEKLNDIHDLGENKGADIAGLVAGAIFGGGALLGGAGAGGAGGGAGAGAGAGGAGAGAGGGSGAGWGSMNFANLNWSDPNTYMQFANMLPSQSGQQPPPQQTPVRPAQLPEWERSSAGPSPSLHTVLAHIARTRRGY